MKLNDIIKGVQHQAVHPQEWEVKGITFASNKVEEGYIFVAQKGVHTDGHLYIEDAISRGACVVVCQQLPETLHDKVTYLQVDNSDYALGQMASNYYDNPSSKLKLIGITGTNGKTTTVTLLHRMFQMAGYKSGLISTIVNRIDEQEVPATHTTPDALELNRLLKQMVDAGCRYCFMEVSSHSVVQQRIAGLTFAGAIFSNITHDHLDFHKTMANYIAAKKKFFDDLPADAFALVNIDDRNGMTMVQNTRAMVKTYSVQRMADFHCKMIENSFHGLNLEINGTEMWAQLVGRFNAYNLTAIYATATLCGMAHDEALRLLSELKPVAGRFEYVHGNDVVAIVDYAHTPDALENVLSTIHDIKKSHQEVITVVGCGGDRDPLKRPVMAQIAAKMSNRVILTSDNPRTENPDTILDQMEAGLDSEALARTIRITDRRNAIKTAVMMAKLGDIILVAGKGHETYQEVNGVRHHFDDKEEVANALNNKKQ
ncbi:MAG: UDP-N-acetylmuramoyl-L-alanyl-D-glutamate--2,6-diaminopimelate ligase [Bacteroidales bacterium]|nr:UDP-N-acetylmuramoyl-L-alanyl-D-glutamate--2,6-diaminopimelate ligase [Bacteroidales bacterium]